MVKNNRDLMEQVILDCFTGLHDLELSMPERICHYILYGKDPMVLDDLNKLTKSNTSNEYDKQVYSLLGCPSFVLLAYFDDSNKPQQSVRDKITILM